MGAAVKVKEKLGKSAPRKLKRLLLKLKRRSRERFVAKYPEFPSRFTHLIVQKVSWYNHKHVKICIEQKLL
jgi:hypothetical protein